MSRHLSKILKSEPKLKVRILSPTQVYYDGPAVAISAVNQVGSFDILANHANFFSLLSAGDVVVTTSSEPFSVPIKHGIIKVKNNEVTLFADIGPASSE